MMQLQTNGAAPASNTRTLPEPDYKVRLAQEADIPQLVALARDLHRENGIVPIDETKVWDLAAIAASKDRAKARVVCGCIGPVGRIEAMVFLSMGMFWYSSTPHLEDLFMYVKPEYRKSTRAKSLIQFAKKCAVELKVPLLIGVLSNERTEAKIRLYQRQLGKPTGSYWLWNGKTGI